MPAARIADLHKSFARHLRAEGCADRTVVVHGQALTFFSRWLESQGRPVILDEPTRAAIREWLAERAWQGVVRQDEARHGKARCGKAWRGSRPFQRKVLRCQVHSPPLVGER
jgi:hypothetical protein